MPGRRFAPVRRAAFSRSNSGDTSGGRFVAAASDDAPRGDFEKDRGVPSSAASSPATSNSLLVRARNHDQEAWRLIDQLYAPLVQKWCRLRYIAAFDALDIGQEVFRAVHRKLADFRKERPTDRFRSWLKTIAINKIHDYWRKRGREMPNCEPETVKYVAEGNPPSTGHGEIDDERAELALLLRRALAMIERDFQERTWTAFWAVVLDERPVGEVAAQLGTTPNAVSLAKSRVMTRLKDVFGELLEGWTDD